MSARSRRVVLGPEASEDLRDVLVYTEQRWGIAQRRAYRRFLFDGFADLAAFPGLGRVRGEYGAEVRSHPIGQHVAIYLATDEERRVVRILHHRRELKSNPDDAPS